METTPFTSPGIPGAAGSRSSSIMRKRFGSGTFWEPSPAMFGNFSGTVYWYRAYDLSNGGFRQLGTWRYTCRRHLGQSMDAPAAQPATEPAKS